MALHTMIIGDISTIIMTTITIINITITSTNIVFIIVGGVICWAEGKDGMMNFEASLQSGDQTHPSFTWSGWWWGDDEDVQEHDDCGPWGLSELE